MSAKSEPQDYELYETESLLDSMVLFCPHAFTFSIVHRKQRLHDASTFHVLWFWS